ICPAQAAGTADARSVSGSQSACTYWFHAAWFIGPQNGEASTACVNGNTGVPVASQVLIHQGTPGSTNPAATRPSRPAGGRAARHQRTTSGAYANLAARAHPSRTAPRPQPPSAVSSAPATNHAEAAISF